MSPELKSEDGAYYQSLIGILRWMVQLGSTDICLEVYMISSHISLPREVHMVQLYRVFAYLKKYHNSEILLIPSDQVIYQADFEHQD